MKFKLFISTVALISGLNAATIQISNVDQGAGDTLYAGIDGSLLSGAGVFSGYFNADSMSFNYATAVSNGDIGALRSNFNILTSAVIGSNSSTLSGSFAGYIESGATSIGLIGSSSNLIGKSLFQFFGNTSDLTSATEFALVNTNIKLSEDAPVEIPYTLNLADGSLVIGKSGVFTGNASGLGSNSDVYSTVQLVPEPSALLLSALGVLGLLRRRR